jgi:hypothetical protein
MHIRTLICLACICLLSGCSPPRGTVTGRVTLDGQPLDKGIISFTPTDARAKENVVADIINGQYSADVLAGPQQVQISAPKVIATRAESPAPGAPLVEITEERLPAKYHSATELTLEVKPGKNDKDWTLQGAPKR